MPTHKNMMDLTADMPMKLIQIDGKPYLERYFAGRYIGFDIWLHRFLSADGDRHLHNHPFRSESAVLCGLYREDGGSGEVWREGGKLGQWGEKIIQGNNIAWLKADTSIIDAHHWHRIVEVDPNTWTALRVYHKGRIPYWFFIDDEGNNQPMPSSGNDWWHGLPTRGEFYRERACN